MRRRSALLLLTLVPLAGCGASGSAEPLASAGTSADYAWPARNADLTSGFCFTLVRGLTEHQITKRLGGDDLERVDWNRVVRPGDGEAGARKRFFMGIGRVGNWSVIVEDNGTLGVTRELVKSLSKNRGEVLAYRGGGGEPGRLVVFRNGDLALDLDTSAPDRLGGNKPDQFRPTLQATGLLGGPAVTDPTASALAFMAARSGVTLTAQVMQQLEYLLVEVPQA
ncbi:DUF6461 domain-containing protein [Actinoplanes sp. NEAU-A12]|uniref:DUF6461 domain-containing protein n=1 Tax=Actinoplanes sandaracinus TaxID=3045177 RepID=A0ABT6WT87_9ACTN|nr:DUF6461 domain-containing protein [Actinoplanes sandaracinus]MDI6099066.1 DUF6461 domain-containing protein [Actinoplanes sandaracinus]MDI6102961.1 DUF6461 domain-containing protein [Actinoplanes sandaracinus]